MGINKNVKRYLCFELIIKKGDDAIKITNNESRYVPPMDAAWINELLKTNDVPNKFQGNPVKKKLRIHSKTTINAAKEM